MEETIVRDSDVFEMLDHVLRDEPAFWDGLYSDRSRGTPFFVNVPDENLVEFVGANRGQTGRAIDIGCGPGRNALFLAKQGWAVDAVDLSPIAVARLRAADDEPLLPPTRVRSWAGPRRGA